MKIILGTDVKSGMKIAVDDRQRQSGMYILGGHGYGKSSLILNLAVQDIKNGKAVILVDAHDDLIPHLIAIMPPERLSKTYLLDMEDLEYPFALKLFSNSNLTNELERADAVELLMHVFEQVWHDSRGIMLDKLLRYIALTFVEYPHYTLADIPRLLRDDAFREPLVNGLQNQEVKAY